MLISKETIEKLKSPELVVPTIKQFVELTLMGKNYVGKSPFRAERSPSFTVRSDGTVWKCFSTGNAGTNAIQFIMKIKHLDYYNALIYLADINKIGIERE